MSDNIKDRFREVMSERCERASLIPLLVTTANILRQAANEYSKWDKDRRLRLTDLANKIMDVIYQCLSEQKESREEYEMMVEADVRER